MRKRLISILLTAAFVIALLPAGAISVFAATAPTISDLTATYASGKVSISFIGGNTDGKFYFYVSESTSPSAPGKGSSSYKSLTINKSASNSTYWNVTSTTNSLYYLYYYTESSDATTSSTISGPLSINGSTSTSTTLTLNVKAMRASTTSGSVNVEVTSNIAGTFKYSTSSSTTTSSYVLPTNGGDVQSNIMYADTVSLDAKYKTLYYQFSYYVTSGSSTKAMTKTGSVTVVAMSVTSFEYVTSNTGKFTYSASGSGTLWYEISDSPKTSVGAITNSNTITSSSSSLTLVVPNASAAGGHYISYYFVSNDTTTPISTFYFDSYTEAISSAPIISSVIITDRKSTSAAMNFSSDSDGILYYRVSSAKVTDKKNITNAKTISKTGTNILNVSGLTSSATKIYYYTTNSEGATSDILSVDIPSYNDNDKTPPSITGATLTRATVNRVTTLTFKFTSSEVGIVYFYVTTSPTLPSGSIAYNAASMSYGTNTITITKADDPYGSLTNNSIYYIYYYPVDASGNKPVDSNSNTIVKSINTAGTDNNPPEITYVYVMHPSEKGGIVYINVNKACTIYYAIGPDSETKTTIGTKNSMALEAGSNSFYISLADKKSHDFYYYLKTADGAIYPAEPEVAEYVTIPEYSTSSSGNIVTIESVSHTPSTMVDGTTGVTITIKAKSDLIASPSFEYDFGDGKWTTSQSKKLYDSIIYPANSLRVRLLNDTDSSNWTVYPVEYAVTNIDAVAPTISSVTRTPTDNTNIIGKVTLTVNATDTAGTYGKASGIAARGYTFDGGKNWQANNYYEYKENIVVAANQIQVRDTAGNISKYAGSFTINNVDGASPSASLISSSRSTVDVGTIKLTSSEAGIFHYQVSMDVAVTNTNKDLTVKSKYDLVKGENTFTIKGLGEYTKGDVAVAVYLEDESGNCGSVFTVYLPEYGSDDKELPVIKSVRLMTTSPTNEPVELVVNAEDNIDLADKAYSFDGGDTWQVSNTFTYKKNQTIAAGTIRVKDAADNIAKYNEAIVIENIDTTAPRLTVKSSSSGSNVTLTITASDDVGLQSSAYSFDEGIRWQASNTLVLTASTIQTFPSGSIQVRDTAGNIGKYTKEITADSLTALIGKSWANPYKDVAATSWYYEYVKVVSEEGLFQGVSSTEFGPTLNMTRAMFVTVLGRLDGIDTSKYTGTTGFTDVKAGQWYTPYILWASKNNIVSGYGDGAFGLNDNITREQMCVIINRFLFDYLKLDKPTAKTISFTDKASVSSWATDAVSICEQLGLVKGANNSFRPKDSSNRAEVATVFSRMIDLIG